jgi:ribonucleoside-diphosphate reductase alpha chain/ribonucleoside-triphosphate reductase
MKVQKRNGLVVDFDKSKIVNAINKAMEYSESGIDTALSLEIADNIEGITSMYPKNYITVEKIQDLVETLLMSSERKEVAKRYILYRQQKTTERLIEKNEPKLLSEEFISEYKHAPSPFTSQLGLFIYYRTYSRFLPELGRREDWLETVRRVVEYNCSLVPTTKDEAEELFDNIYNLRQFPSGRSLWVGGTDIVSDYGLSAFNCTFTRIQRFTDFTELFYLLMLGAGVGFRILKSDVQSLPRVRTGYTLIHKDYEYNSEKVDFTSTDFTSDETVTIRVGDSKEGWTQALEAYFRIISDSKYRTIKTIIIDYDYVREKGSKLKKFGGTASGHESLKDMFTGIDKTLKRENTSPLKLRPIHCLDICNIIGENVVSGGVRRTSEVGLIDSDDEEVIKAKSNLYIEKDGKWQLNKEIGHRRYSNNTIVYTYKPSREEWHTHMTTMRYSGEPAFMNLVAAMLRRADAEGGNPCMEILLRDKGTCNLTTVNAMAFVEYDETIRDYVLSIDGLMRTCYMSARVSYRMTCIELEMEHWNDVHKEDRLTGCSLTGWQDMVNACDFTKDEEASILASLRHASKKGAYDLADALGLPRPKLVTTVKPEGSLSLLPVVSSGVHYSHSPYYIRRVRISADDPLCKVCEELEYPVFPEVGESEESCKTKVIEFPVKAPEGKTKRDVYALEQLENYKRFMTHYCDQNVSITVHVRNDEWQLVEDWVYENWDGVVAMSFLSYDESFHQLQPYEEITEEEYRNRVALMKPFDPMLISKYEVEQAEYEIDEKCESGACPIR